MAELLAEQDRLDELRDRADAGDDSAARWLTDLLARHSRLDGPWAEICGTPYSKLKLIELLDQQGETEQAERIDNFDLKPDSSVADGDRESHPS